MRLFYYPPLREMNKQTVVEQIQQCDSEVMPLDEEDKFESLKEQTAELFASEIEPFTIRIHIEAAEEEAIQEQ